MSSTISWIRTVRLQQRLAHLLLWLSTIDGCFNYSTSLI